MILDVRANNGGYFGRTNKGLNLLFKHSPPVLGLAKRDSDEDLYSLRRFNAYRLNVDSTIYFDGPIAVLTGSLTISAADFFALRLTEHPNVKLFGSPPSGSYSSLKRKFIGKIIVSYSYLNGFIDSDSVNYLSHTTLPVDYEVSFTPEDVVNGTDTVVKEAVKWINENIILTVQNTGITSKYFLSQNYPNPFNPTTTISYSVPKRSTIILKVFDVLGKEVGTLINETKQPGIYKIEFNASYLPNGVYFYRLQSGDFFETKKFMVLK